MLCHPSAQFFTYALAVLSCGACCVVLNWRQPQEPLVEMSQRAECSHIVAAPPFEEAARLICKSLSLRGVLWLLPPSRSLLEDEAVLPALDGENAPRTRPFSDAKIRHEPTLRPDALAFIMFTSGSTATPKGVPLTHGGLVWLCHQRLAATPDAFSAPHAGTLSLLPNFHVIGAAPSLCHLPLNLTPAAGDSCARTPLNRGRPHEQLPLLPLCRRALCRGP